MTAIVRATGKRSGAPIERTHAQIWSFSEGKVIRVQIIDTRAEALRAVGLDE